MSALQLIIGNKNYSSWSMRPWLFLKASGVDFEEHRIALFTAEWQSDIAALSPSGKVPVLKDGSLQIWDSLAICEYVNERFEQANGWPDETDARAIARSVAAEMHSGFNAVRDRLPMNCRKRFTAFELPGELEPEIDRIRAIWRDCRQRFGDDGPWLFGRFGIVDAMFAPVVMRFITYDVTLSGLEQAYVETMLGHAAVTQWLNDARAETEIIERAELKGVK